MSKKNDGIKFLPDAPTKLTQRIVLRVTTEEHEILNEAARLLSSTPTEIVRYAFENAIIPGIQDELEKRKPTRSSSGTNTSHEATPTTPPTSSAPPNSDLTESPKLRKTPFPSLGA